MADIKISALPAASEFLPPDELPVNEAGTTKKLTVAQLMLEQHRLQFASTDLLSARAISSFNIGEYFASVIGTGTISGITGTSNHPGIIRFSSPTTSGNGGGVVGIGQSLTPLGGGEVFESIFRPQNFDASTNEILGFSDASDFGSVANAAFIYLNSSFVAKGRTVAASTGGDTGTSITLSTNTWYRARVEVNANATQVDFYIFSDAGVQLWHDSRTTNIPTAAVGPLVSGYTASSGGVQALMDVDYVANWRFCTRG